MIPQPVTEGLLLPLYHCFGLNDANHFTCFVVWWLVCVCALPEAAARQAANGHHTPHTHTNGLNC
jgi:hypothetical protein